MYSQRAGKSLRKCCGGVVGWLRGIGVARNLPNTIKTVHPSMEGSSPQTALQFSADGHRHLDEGLRTRRRPRPLDARNSQCPQRRRQPIGRGYFLEN